MRTRLKGKQVRDRCLAPGFGHAMGFDSPAGLPGLKPSGPLSNPQIDLLGPRVLDSASALSDVCHATVVSDFAFVLNFDSYIDRWLWRRVLAQLYKSSQSS